MNEGGMGECQLKRSTARRIGAGMSRWLVSRCGRPWRLTPNGNTSTGRFHPAADAADHFMAFIIRSVRDMADERREKEAWAANG